MSDAAPQLSRSARVLGPVRRWVSSPERAGRHLSVVPVRMPSGSTPLIVATGIILVALLALATSHALLIKRQTHLDSLDRAVSAEVETIRGLRLDVALLESPDRVLQVARDELGMVSPAEVGYLLPVNSLGDDTRIRVDAAAPPPASVIDPDAAQESPEKEAVDNEPTTSPPPPPTVVGDQPPPADKPATSSRPESDSSSDRPAEDRPAEDPPADDAAPKGEDDPNNTPARPAPSGDFDLGDG